MLQLLQRVSSQQIVFLHLHLVIYINCPNETIQPEFKSELFP